MWPTIVVGASNEKKRTMTAAADHRARACSGGGGGCCILVEARIVGRANERAVDEKKALARLQRSSTRRAIKAAAMKCLLVTSKHEIARLDRHLTSRAFDAEQPESRLAAQILARALFIRWFVFVLCNRSARLLTKAAAARTNPPLKIGISTRDERARSHFSRIMAPRARARVLQPSPPNARRLRERARLEIGALDTV